MSNTSDFVKNFTDYLENPARLPFIAPRYAVIPPKLQSSLLGFTDQKEPNLIFQFQMGDGIFGDLGIVPPHASIYAKKGEKCLYINSIHARPFGMPDEEKNGWLGGEILRRAVLYACENDFDTVRTSIYVGSSTSFWFSMGFRSVLPVEPTWPHMMLPPEDIEEWRARIQQSPDALWDLARTEIGREALFNKGGPGVLDLHDDKQRHYAFSRLRLPQPLKASAHPA